MCIKELNIEQLVEDINQELAKGRTMKDIENNDFKVNDRVITKRLTRKGYKRIGNEFTKNITNDIQKDNKPKMKVLEERRKTIAPTESKDIQIYNQSINSEKLMELLELVDPIKEMLEEYNRNKNVIHTIELRPKAVTKVKQKLFKVDVNILEQWEQFVSKHKEYKVQQLISMALEEFIQKYN